MSSRTNYLEDAWLNHILRGDQGGTALAQPAAVYAALFTAITDGETSSVTEVTGGGYTRKQATFDAPASGVCATNASITYENMPAVTVVGVGVYDAASGGNLLYYKTLAASVPFNVGETAVITTGSLTVTAT